MVKEFNYQDMTLLNVDYSNHIVEYRQPYVVAMNAFLADINILNDTNMSPLFLEDDLLFTPYRADPNISFKPTTLIQKQTFRLLANGVRFLRVRTD